VLRQSVSSLRPTALIAIETAMSAPAAYAETPSESRRCDSAWKKGLSAVSGATKRDCDDEKPYMIKESFPPSFLCRVELLRRLLPLIPAGLLVQQVLPDPDRIIILSRPSAASSVCPLCGKPSLRVHSRY
jgi:hypothetical protein